MPNVQSQVRLPEKALKKLAAEPIKTKVVPNNDPSKPGHKARSYTLDNPPPHLRSVRKDLLSDALKHANGDWYLLEALSNGIMIHNNRAQADRFRKLNKTKKAS